MSTTSEVPKTVFAIGDKLYTRTSDGEYILLKIHRARWRGVAAWIAVFTLITFFALGVSRHQDRAIQRSRVTSCIRTYGSFSEVFRPFFPPDTKQTPKQRADLAKLNRTVTKLQQSCGQQVKAPVK